MKSSVLGSQATATAKRGRRPGFEERKVTPEGLDRLQQVFTEAVVFLEARIQKVRDKWKNDLIGKFFEGEIRF